MVYSKRFARAWSRRTTPTCTRLLASIHWNRLESTDLRSCINLHNHQQSTGISLSLHLRLTQTHTHTDTRLNKHRSDFSLHAHINTRTHMYNSSVQHAWTRIEHRLVCIALRANLFFALTSFFFLFDSSRWDRGARVAQVKSVRPLPSRGVSSSRCMDRRQRERD